MIKAEEQTEHRGKWLLNNIPSGGLELCLGFSAIEDFCFPPSSLIHALQWPTLLPAVQPGASSLSSKTEHLLQIDISQWRLIFCNSKIWHASVFIVVWVAWVWICPKSSHCGSNNCVCSVTNWDRGWNVPIFGIMKIMHLVRLMKRLTFDPESIFSHSFRLLQTERMSQSIQIHPVELNWDKRWSCHELNSSQLSSTFVLSLIW